MKDRVNFLTSLRAGEHFKNRVRQGILMGGVLGAAVIAVYFGVLQYHVGKMKKVSSAMETEVDNLKDLHMLHATLDDKKGELLERRDRLRKMLDFQQGARNGQNQWSGILADLAQSLPPGVWLDQLQVKPFKRPVQTLGETETDGAGNEAEAPRKTIEQRVLVTLSGKAFSQEELLDFLADMEQDPLWESATLKKSDREKNNATSMPDLYRFEILLVLAG